jgi:WD40 repeat protein/DNA-binding SARP family transcriptional activator
MTSSWLRERESLPDEGQVSASGTGGDAAGINWVSAPLTVGLRMQRIRTVRIAVLGPLSIDGSPNGLAPRDRAVLTALAVRFGDALDVDVLAQVLWGDDAPTSGAKVIQGCVVRLRRKLGPSAIETTPRGYRLAIQADQIDTRRFEGDLDRGRELLQRGEPDRAAHAFAQGLDLWRGRPFAECDEWVPARIEAERLRELRLQAEELAVLADIECGRYDQGAATAQALVTEEPLRERRWEMLARAQYGSGRQVEALRTLDIARRFLADEAGLDPGSELAGLEEAILSHDPSLASSFALPAPSLECPYMGLLPFGPDDTEVFFGRDREIAECLRYIEEFSILSIIGDSGSGKSSLVRAGLVPALERQGRRVVVITPGSNPLRAITALPTMGAPPVLVVDQCEEAVTLCSDGDVRRRFFDMLVEHASRAPLVLVMRPDVLGEFSEHISLSRVVERGMYLLGPMDETGLRSAITLPAEHAGLRLEPGLVELLVRDIEGEPGALPLLSHSLRATWEIREGGALTVTGYQATGGIRGAVSRTAESLFTSLDPDDQAAVRSLLLRLVSLGPEGEPTIGKVSKKALPSDARNLGVVEAMIGQRLLSTDGDNVQVAHEALVRAWPRLQSWLDEDVEGGRILRHLNVSAETWDGMGRPDSELYRGARLASAIDWQESAGPQLSDTELAFLSQSRQLTEAEASQREERARHQARLNRQLRALLGGAVVLLVVALSAGWLFLREADRASFAASVAEARRVSAQAQLTTDSDVSLLMAVEALNMADLPDTRSALLAAINRDPALIAIGRTTPGVAALAVTRGGAVIVGDFYDATSIHDGTTLARIEVPGWGGVEGRGVSDLAVRPGSGHVVVATSFADASGLRVFDGSPPIVVLDPDTLEESAIRLGGLPVDRWGFGPVFSADGRYLAVGFVGYEEDSPLVDGWSVMVWDLTKPDVPVLEMETAWINAMTLSAAGDHLHLVSDSSTYTIHELPGGAEIARADVAPAPLFTSPDGATMATHDGADVVLFNPSTLGEIGRLTGLENDGVRFSAFSHDGRLIAAGDGVTIRVWDVETGDIVHRLVGPSRLTHLAFSADDTTLFSVGYGGVLAAHDLEGSRRFPSRVWEISANERGDDWFDFVAVASPDGGKVALAFHPGRPDADWTLGVRVLDLSTGSVSERVDPGHDFWGDLWWSPDSQRLATVGSDGHVRVWDPATMEPILERRVADEHLSAVRYTQDGERILVTQRGGTVRLLDATDLSDVASTHADVEGIIWGAVSPDARTAMVIAGSSEFVVLDVVAGSVLHRVPIEGRPWSGDFSPDGTTLMIGGDTGVVGFFDLDRGGWIAPPTPAHRDATFVRFSPDGRLAVSGSYDGIVSLWDPADGRRIGMVQPTTTLSNPSFLPDGSTVIVPAIAEGEVYVWDTSTSAWVAHACAVVRRQFTVDEWTTVFGDMAYRSTCPGGS